MLCKRVSEEVARLGHRVRVLTSDVGSVDAYYRYGVAPAKGRPTEINGVEIVTIPYGGVLYDPIGRWIDESLPGALANRLGNRLLQWIGNRFRAALAREISAFHPDVVMTSPHLVVNVESVMRIRRTMPFPLVWLPLLHENQDFSAFRTASRQVDAAMALTEHEANLLRSEIGFPAEAVFTAGVGIDLPERNATAPRGDCVLFLGRKDPGKGVPRLLSAMRLVWEKHPAVTLVLAGARTPDTAVIDGLVAALPAQQRAAVSSLDDVSEQHKHELLAGVRCLVLPSRMESFGLVLLEAWSCGTPVVASDLPVFRGTVDHGDNGLLVEPDSDIALAGAILRFIENPAFAEQLGAAGKKKVTQRYRWGAVAERFLAAYEFAMEAHRRR